MTGSDQQRITQHKRFVPFGLTQIFASQKHLLCWERYRAFKKTAVKQITNIIIGLTLLLFTACGQGQIKTPKNAMKNFTSLKVEKYTLPHSA